MWRAQVVATSQSAWPCKAAQQVGQTVGLIQWWLVVGQVWLPAWELLADEGFAFALPPSPTTPCILHTT